jgi:hypothetical protein
VVLIYAAIIFVRLHVEAGPLVLCSLATLAIVAGVIGARLLIRFQYDLGELRNRAATANQTLFSTAEREALGLRRPKHPYGRGWHVLAALVGVCVAGAIVVVMVVVLGIPLK